MFYLFLKFLSHDDIINIFKMNNVKYRIIECEMAEVVEKIINKFKYIPNIKIRKNELLKEKYSIVKYFLENIDKYKLRFNEFGFYNAIECIEKNSVKKIKIASLRLKYNSKFFKLKFAQYNLKLMVWIYNENDIFLYKDIIYRIEDLDRIFLFIKDI